MSKESLWLTAERSTAKAEDILLDCGKKYKDQKTMRIELKESQIKAECTFIP